MRSVAPGRVNLIGDHTDYTGGLVFPMAIDRRTTIECEPDDGRIVLASNDADGVVDFEVGSPYDPEMTPAWGRYVAAVCALAHDDAQAQNSVPLGHRHRGLRGTVSTTIPVGAGLSSSAALEVATALAIGVELGAVDLATLCRRAEHLATGVPTGIMDQLCIATARVGHGTLIDCRSLEVRHVPIPDDVQFVVRFVAHRTLQGSEYADRVAECAAAETVIGALRDATMGDIDRINDPVVRSRARHVVGENARVRDFVEAISTGRLVEAGEIMNDGHESLSRDFATSTPQMDAAVTEIRRTPGVLGARMTGGGFGGCVVAMCRPQTQLAGWRVSPAAGPLVEM